MATVEERHRHAAAVAMLTEHEVSGDRVRRWVTTGLGLESYADLRDVAQGYAEAEERGRAAGRLAEREDVFAEYEEHAEALLKHEAEHNEEGAFFADRELLAHLRKVMTEERHVGAAARRKAGR